MRRFVLGQIVASLAVAAISLASFAIFDVWEKFSSARIAAMGIALLFAVYPAIILFRLLVRRRDWDGPTETAFAAGAAAVIAMTGLLGGILVVLTVSVWSVAEAVRTLNEFFADDRRWFWQRPHSLLWAQFLTTTVFLVWLVVR